jgi:hypothetical protein
MASAPARKPVFGWWPMATKMPSIACSLTCPLRVSRSLTPVTAGLSVPRISTTSAFQMKRILGFLRARSCMIFDARSASRRCTTTTSLAKRVRNIASSIAVSPPPTTMTRRSRKKAPSQVAHAEAPNPMKRASLGIPSSFADAPVATITVRAW